MPDERDIEVVRLFVAETVQTYEVVGNDPRTARVTERERLAAAIIAFNEGGHPERIVSQYAHANDEDLRNAGLYGRQLRSKRELARLASEDFLVPEAARTGGMQRLSRFSRPGIRRWIKRCKVLIGSLKGIVPGAEALNELLDLLDAALDRA